MRKFKTLVFLLHLIILYSCSGDSDNSLPPSAESDIIAPTIMSYTPISNAYDQEVLIAVTINFNEKIKLPSRENFHIKPYKPATSHDVLPCIPDVAKTIVDSSLPLPTNCTNNVSAISYGDNQSILKYTPCDNLVENTRYQVTVKNVKDLAGNVQKDSITFDFSTNSKPYICSIIPMANSIHDSLNPVIKITFNEPISDSSLFTNGIANFSLTTTANAIPIIFKPPTLSISTNTILSIELLTALVENTEYSASITGGASGLKDIAGNVLQDFGWTFTAKVDSIQPSILSISPLNKTTVSPYSSLIISFSEPMDITSLNPATTANSFNLYEIISGNPVKVTPFDFSFNYDLATDSVIYLQTKNPALKGNTQYRAIQTTLATDKSNNPILAEASTDFSTSAIPISRNLTTAELVAIWYLIL